MTPITSLWRTIRRAPVLREMLVLVALWWAWTLDERRNEKRAAAKKFGSA
jgi:hypothetical protein